MVITEGEDSAEALQSVFLPPVFPSVCLSCTMTSVSAPSLTILSKWLDTFIIAVVIYKLFGNVGIL